MSRTRTRERNRDRARGRRTISISVRERGQTTQDFAIGIGVFLLAVAFVFSFLPSVVTPFDSSVGGAETAQADRIADRIVHNASTGTSNELNETKLNETYAEDNLTAQLGLRASVDDDAVYDRVNVSVETFQGNAVNSSGLSGGDAYHNDSAASAARVVTVVDASGAPITDASGNERCDPACRLVVRVW